MKKCFILLLICMLLLLSACAPAGLSPSVTTAAPTATTAPSNGVIDLRDYDCGIDNSVFNNDTLKELIRLADEILNSGEEFWFENNYYLNYLCVCCPAAIPARIGSQIIVDLPFEGRTDLQIDTVRYLIVLQFITKEYADCIYAQRCNPLTTQYHPFMNLSTHYREAGYSTIDDYIRAAANGECERNQNDYLFDIAGVYVCRDRLPNDLYGNLVDEVLQAQQEG